MTNGRSVRLYLVDGVATGILTAEIMNWTGHVLASPRTRIDEALKREELRRTGIYFLTGPDDQGSDLDRVYVGEGDEIGTRLKQHNKEKEFWERFIAVTSKDSNLTKSHVRYLEARLIKMINEAREVKVDNSNTPEFDRLPESDIADMDTFLEEVNLILPVIGATFLRTTSHRHSMEAKPGHAPGQGVLSSDKTDSQVSKSPVFHFESRSTGISARAVETEGEFVVLKDSTGCLNEAPSLGERFKAIRRAALASGRTKKLDTKNLCLSRTSHSLAPVPP